MVELMYVEYDGLIVHLEPHILQIVVSLLSFRFQAPTFVDFFSLGFRIDKDNVPVDINIPQKIFEIKPALQMVIKGVKRLTVCQGIFGRHLQGRMVQVQVR